MPHIIETLLFFTVGAPLLFTLALATSPRVSVRGWLQAIAVVSVLELTMLGFSPSPSHSQLHEILIMSVLIVLFPWAASALFLGVARYPSHHILVARGFTFVYLVSFVFGLVAAINLLNPPTGYP